VLNQTYCAETPNGGCHFYYQYDPSLLQVQATGTGIDVRNDGGYVVGGGSDGYTATDRHLVKIEAILKEFLASKQVSPVVTAKPEHSDGLIVEGGRNNFLTQ